MFSLFRIQAGNKFIVSQQIYTVTLIGQWSMRLGNDILSYLKYKYETLSGADHLTFDGRGRGWFW